MSAGDLFRWSRWLHGYLSAFAFLSLIFFSATGLILNHPEWIRDERGSPTPIVLTLSPQALAAAKAARDPNRALAAAVAAATPIAGQYKDAQTDEGEALLRWEGAKGYSDATVDLATGKTDVKVAHASPVAFLNELHRARRTGGAWKLVVDVSAVVFMLMSLIGYVLFFSLRFRLVPSLIVTAVSLALMGAVIWLLTA